MNNFIKKFTEEYKTAPSVFAQAPGRLEILGNHTDYNQGVVLSCAVKQRTYMGLFPVEGNHCKVKDFRDGSSREFDLDNIATAVPKDWSNYIKGIIVELEKRGIKVGAFNAAIESDIPLSAGMSSSAALEVATGFALKEAFNIELSNAQWAVVGQGVENNYLGLKSGLLDQFSSIFGKDNSFILSDFRTIEVIRTVEMPKGYSIVVINSMIKHNLVDSEYNSRREDCESAAEKLSQIYAHVKTLRDISSEELERAKDVLTQREYRRAAHVVGECERVFRGIRALENSDIKAFGNLWFESHQSSKEFFENSTPEMDYLVELAKSMPNGLGARLSGGGFGGITIHLVATEEAEDYAKSIAAAFKVKYGVEAEYIISSAGAGASSEKI